MGASAVEANHVAQFPTACTLDALSVQVNEPPGTVGGSTPVTHLYTVRLNFVDTGLACSISGSAMSCTSFNAVTVVAGDFVSVRFVGTGLAGAEQGATLRGSVSLRCR